MEFEAHFQTNRSAMVCMKFLVILPSLGEAKNQRNRVVDPSNPKHFLASRRSLEGQKAPFHCFPGSPALALPHQGGNKRFS